MMNVRKGYIPTGSLHQLYFETYGDPSGIPIIFIHGGPGYGFFKVDKRFFDPKVHFVILYDQRGAGKSKPYSCVENNTTQDLVEDLNILLTHFNLSEAHLFGGSWGSTLAMLFAIKYPEKVTRLILRGIFSAAHNSIDLFAPIEDHPHLQKCKDRVLSFVPGNDPSIAGEYYLMKMRDGSEEEKRRYAFELELYGSILNFPEKPVQELEEEIGKRDHFAHSIIIAHYMVNKFFLPDNYIWDHLSNISEVPTIIIHGTKDKLCPVENAHHLHRSLNKSTIYILDAGHSSLDPIIDEKLKEVMSSIRK